ncbi:MAG TPA: isoprenylcysteine carboxylmethyltransferase family protein [Bryobacteraceae bacterium]|nr:isoprenylcysteine carboxylmethyltransferase family protein [Bryobacteraceae bacterium]
MNVSAGVSRAMLRIPVPWVFVLSYLAGAGLEKLSFGHARLMDSMSVTVAGAILFVLGAVLAAWGWGIFRRVKTTRVPGEISVALVTWGPYRFTRNPMYVGLAAAYVGEAGLLHQLFPLLLLPLTIGYLDRVVIPLEEKKLREVFGAKYESYSGKVRRWL